MPALSRFFLFLVAFLVGGITFALAVPRTVGEISLLTAESSSRAEAEGTEELMRRHRTEVAVFEAIPSGELALRMAATEFAIARNFPMDSRGRRLWLDMTETSVERSVMNSPGNSYAWSRLAYLRIRSGAESFGAAKGPLILSILTGPREEPLVYSRIRRAIRIWDYLSDDDIALLEDQILWADRLNRNRLIKIGKRDRRSMMIVFGAMAKDLNQFKPFIEAFNR